MLRTRLIVPVAAFALSAMTAVVPFVTSASADAPAVTIHDSGAVSAWGYGPDPIAITAGQSVTWTNTGTSPHDATASDGSWNTPLLQPGASASVTFSTPGTFTYTCQLHPWMKGTIVVSPSASAPAADTSAVSAPATDTSAVSAPATDDSTVSAPPAPAAPDVAPDSQPADNTAPDSGSDSGS